MTSWDLLRQLPSAATHNALLGDDAVESEVRAHIADPDGDMCDADAVESMRRSRENIPEAILW